MPVMNYTYPVVTVPPLNSQTPPFEAPVEIFFTIPDGYGCFIVKGDIIGVTTDQDGNQLGPDQLGSVESITTSLNAVGYELNTIISQNTTRRILFNKSTKVTIIYYTVVAQDNLGQPTEYSATPTTDCFNIFNIVFQAPSLRATISPDRSLVFSEPTVYTVTAPSDYYVLIVLGDAEMTYTNIQDADDAGDLIQMSDSKAFGIISSTRVRLYYADINSNVFDSNFDDFIITLIAPPIVTVADYGNSVSFEVSTIIKIRSNIPCSLEFSLRDLESKQEIVNSIVEIDESLSFDIPISTTCVLYIRGFTTEKTSEVKEYIFKRESVEKRVATSYTFYKDSNNNKISNNVALPNSVFAGCIHNFLDADGSVSKDFDMSKTVRLNSVEFCNVSNSFICGSHPLYSTQYNGNRSYDMGWQFYTTTHFIYRLHYKVVGLSFYVGQCHSFIYIGDTLKFIVDDCEGWLYGASPDPINSSNALNFSLSKPSGLVTTTYLEIDYLELVGQKINIDLSYKQFRSAVMIPNILNPGGWDMDVHIPIVGQSDDFLFTLQATTDYTVPSDTNSLPVSINTNNSTVSIHTTITEACVFFQRIIYQNYLHERENNNFIPCVYQEQVSVISDSLSKYVNYSPAIEDFSMGGLRLNWQSSIDVNRSWVFTSRGIESPKIYYGSSDLTSNWVYNIIGKQVVIEYEVFPAPGQDRLLASVAIKAENSSDTYYPNLTKGPGTLTINLSSDSTSLWLHYQSYAYAVRGSINCISQCIVIKKIEFVGCIFVSDNRGSEYPSIERWPNQIASWPWQFVGNWHYPPPSPPSDTLYLIPPNIDDNQDASIYFVVDCIDGEIAWTWAISSEGGCDYGEFWYDGVLQSSISGKVPLRTDSMAVSLGVHTFKFRYRKDGSVSIGYDTVYIQQIVFPKLSNQVCDSVTFSSFNPTFDGSLGSKPWSWTPLSQFPQSADVIPTGMGVTIPAHTTDISYMQVQLPLDLSSTYAHAYWRFNVVSTGDTYYYAPRITLETNWDNYYINKNYTRPIWSDYVYSTGVHNISENLPMPLPETGTIKFKIEGRNSPSNIDIYFDKIEMPLAEHNYISIDPVEDVVIFPITCTMTSKAKIFYTLDGSDPTISSTAIQYTTPLKLTEPSVIKYTSYLNEEWGIVEAKYYLDRPAKYGDIIKYVYTVGWQTYVVFLSLPTQVPIIIGQVINGYFTYKLYDGKPIAVKGGDKLIVGHTTITDMPTFENIESTKSTFNADYTSFRIITIDAPKNGLWPKPIFQTHAVEEEAVSFAPNAIVSMPSGVYNHSVKLTMRPNFPECQIFYTVVPK
jgi:hypothetical protein